MNFKTRFRRNEVKNLCRTRGFRLVRFWSSFYQEWHYRTEPLRLVGAPSVKLRHGLEYCPTHVPPLTRVYYHMLNKAPRRIVKP